MVLCTARELGWCCLYFLFGESTFPDSWRGCARCLCGEDEYLPPFSRGWKKSVHNHVHEGSGLFNLVWIYHQYSCKALG